MLPKNLSFPSSSIARRSSLACAAILALSLCGHAHAQSVDYGSLEDLFGEPVTTSVTGSPQRASDVPASMIIVTQDEIRKSGARDLPGVLAHVPGLDVLRWTNDYADVAARGYNQTHSPRLLVLVDGRQVYSDDYGYTPWSTIPVELSDIRQIEIVLGPNSALFGFNAVGGVINIVTYDPLYDDVNTLSATGGTQNLIQGSAVATYQRDDQAGVRVSLGGRSNDDFNTPQAALLQGSRHGDSREAFNLLAHFVPADTIDASIEITHTEAAQSEVIPLTLGYFTTYSLSSLKAHVMADTDAGLIQATVYYNWFDTNLSPGPLGFFVYRLRNDVFVAQLQDIFRPSADQTVRLSAEYRHNTMSTSPIAVAHVFYDVLSGSAMWNWALTPQTALTNSIRVDHLSLGRTGSFPPGITLTNDEWNRRTITEISFNSGLVWQPDRDNTIRLTAARGVQVPSLVNFGGIIQPGPFGYSSGLPTLKPTIVTNYDADWDHDIPEWNAKFQLRAFYQFSSGIIANIGGSLPAKGLAISPANIGNSQAGGAELIFRQQLTDQFAWSLSYTPEVIDDSFKPGFNAETVLIDFDSTHPVHVVKASAEWSAGPWEASAYARYESANSGTLLVNPILTVGGLTRIPAYVAVDARVAYRIGDNLTVALSGQNLLDSPQKQTAGADIQRSIQATLTLAF